DQDGKRRIDTACGTVRSPGKLDRVEWNAAALIENGISIHRRGDQADKPIGIFPGKRGEFNLFDPTILPETPQHSHQRLVILKIPLASCQNHPHRTVTGHTDNIVEQLRGGLVTPLDIVELQKYRCRAVSAGSQKLDD